MAMLFSRPHRLGHAARRTRGSVAALIVLIVLIVAQLDAATGVQAVPMSPGTAPAARDMPDAGVARVPSPSGGTGWVWPIGGPRDASPTVVRVVEPPAQPWLSGHRGVDLLGSPGEAIRSAGAGTVAFAGRVGTKPTVVVTHAGGLRTTYEPVEAAVAAGDHVAPGSVLGRLSSAGSHCFPRTCLHWGLLRGEAYLDPLELVAVALRVRLLPVWARGG